MEYNHSKIVLILLLTLSFIFPNIGQAVGGQGTATIDGSAPGGNVTVTTATSHKFTIVLTIGVSGITANAQNPTFTIPAGFTAPNTNPVANAGLVDADGKWSVTATGSSNGGTCTVNTPDAGLTIASGQVITVDVTTTCATGFTPPDSITLTYQGQSPAAMGPTALAIGTAVDIGAGAVTPISNPPTITVADAPITLNVIKHVINDNGGAAVANAWTLAVTSSNGGTGGSASGTELGSTYALQAGKAYSVAESGGPSGYSASSSTDCTIGNAVSGATYTCTITDNDIAPFLHLRKTVDNTGGGTASNTAWTLTATGILGSPTNLTGTTPVDSNAAFKADTYTLAENGGPSGYTASAYSCIKNGGGAVISNSIALANGDNATCTIANTYIITPTTETITVINVIVGGTKGIADFPLFVNGSPVASGDTNSFNAPAAYTVTETSNPNYLTTFSGFCPNGIVTLTLGTPKTCTITNTYVAPSAPPISGSGGIVLPMPPLIDLVKVPSPLSLPAGPGPVTYTYTLRNIGTVPVANITMTGDACSPIILSSGDANANAKLDVNETWIYHCTAVLSKTQTNTVVATGWANGISAIDIASATVVVGVSVVPPLIHVTKIPSPILLATLGGMVTYTNTVTNPGTVALSNIRLADDKCNSVKYISGDMNGDAKLDPAETWTYTCSMNLAKTTTNTITAEGDANGLSAKDFAIVTVVVANVAPKLPNTGFPPYDENTAENIIMLSGLSIVALSIVLILRKYKI
ncbi:MAG TPA: hypothetical protein VMR49_01000 [Candidatus Paceibacterota bacterium]|nr:hypothetical protein [Candidatus Paceibacterota bacterium]